jgi:hypothetical protein
VDLGSRLALDTAAERHRVAAHHRVGTELHVATEGDRVVPDAALDEETAAVGHGVVDLLVLLDRDVARPDRLPVRAAGGAVVELEHVLQVLEVLQVFEIPQISEPAELVLEVRGWGGVLRLVLVLLLVGLLLPLGVRVVAARGGAGVAHPRHRRHGRHRGKGRDGWKRGHHLRRRRALLVRPQGVDLAPPLERQTVGAGEGLERVVGRDVLEEDLGVLVQVAPDHHAELALGGDALGDVAQRSVGLEGDADRRFPGRSVRGRSSQCEERHQGRDECNDARHGLTCASTTRCAARRRRPRVETTIRPAMVTTIGRAAVLQMAASASDAAKKRFRHATTAEAAWVPSSPRFPWVATKASVAPSASPRGWTGRCASPRGPGWARAPRGP